MRENRPPEAWETCGLDAYLTGDAAAPDREASPFQPLCTLLTFRLGLANAFDGTPRPLRAFWDTLDRITRYTAGNAWKGPRVAEGGRQSVRTAWLHAKAREEQATFDAASTLLDDDSAFGSYASVDAITREYRVIRGIAALCSWEMGDDEAGDDVAAFAAQGFNTDGGDRYAAAVLGMMRSPDRFWPAGAPCRGRLADALWDGREFLGLNERRPPTQRVTRPDTLAAMARREPEPEEAPAAEISDGPSLLVLASVDHLPGSARTGGERASSVGTSPRSEYGPFAGRRWPLVRVPDLTDARQTLVAEFPYADGVIDAILRDLAGRPHVHVRPVLLVGGPGSGKTRLARRIGEVLKLAVEAYGCAGVSDASFTGTSRQWGTGRACVPLQVLRRHGAASALIVLDEIEKVGTSRHNGSALDAMLPLLTSDAARFLDPFVECPVDLSGVSYVATANSVEGLRRSHGPLVDRFRVFTMPAPRPEDLPAVLRTIMADLRAERGLGIDWMPDLDPSETALIAENYAGGSLRLVRRLAETVVAGRDALATRM